MAVAIRLTRVGATKRPAYRVIAIDKRRSRDGRALEILGFYDPLTDPATVQLDTDRIKAWIGKGAQPSDMVVRLMRQADETAKAETDAPPGPKPATRPAKGKVSKKAAAKTAATAEAPKPDEAPAVTAADEPAADVTEPVAEAEPESAAAAEAEPESAAAAEPEETADAPAADADEPAETSRA